MDQHDLELTKKYLDAYGEFCKGRECGEGCPVFDEHTRTPKVSCFKIFCQLKETGKL